MKKLDFPIALKIYNKTLASDIVSISELSKKLSNKEKTFFSWGDKESLLLCFSITLLNNL